MHGLALNAPQDGGCKSNSQRWRYKLLLSACLAFGAHRPSRKHRLRVPDVSYSRGISPTASCCCIRLTRAYPIVYSNLRFMIHFNIWWLVPTCYKLCKSSRKVINHSLVKIQHPSTTRRANPRYPPTCQGATEKSAQRPCLRGLISTVVARVF